MKCYIRVLLCVVLFFSLFLGGCTAKGEQSAELLVDVCLEQGRGFVSKSYMQTVESRSDVVFELKLQEDFEITGCSFPDYSVSEAENGYTLLELHQVNYPVRVTMTCEIPETIILYDPNGGAFADPDSGEKPRVAGGAFVDTDRGELLRVVSGPSVHYRTNTISGTEKLARPGYVLTGWNTAADGSGEHIGLGSRVTVDKNTALYLYAEWKQETDVELFDWQNAEDGICLIGYNGDDTNCLVIPEEIDGIPVTEIGAGFVSQLQIEELVIPDSVLAIRENAFSDCMIEKIYFSDTLQEVSDAAFPGSRPKYWHINAVMEPRYQATSDVAVFSDKMDLLMMHQNEKKLLLFSGCSMNYGMDSQLLQEAYPDYMVLNLGAVGGTNTQFQFEILLQYIREGDLVLHAPEQGSPYQLMSDTDCDHRMFIAVEGNYDLLSAVDMTTLGDEAFDSFKNFNEKRRSLEPCTYEDQYIPVNSYGDNDQERNASNTEQFDSEYRMHTEYLTENSLDTLCSYYDRIRETGGTVVLSYAPINELCCSQTETEEFSKSWEQGMRERGYETISCLSDYVMDAKYFYDTDYHLTTRGAVVRTEQLIQDLVCIVGSSS